MTVMRVYISGGQDRQKFTNGLTQTQIKEAIQSEFPQVQVVKSGKTDYIIIDDANTSGPSDTALKTDGEIIHYSVFMQMMQRRKKNSKTSAKKTNAKKTNAKKASDKRMVKVWCGKTETMDEEKDTNPHDQQKPEEPAQRTNAIILFTKYAAYVYMMVMNNVQNMDALMSTTIDQIATLLVSGKQSSNVESMKEAWKAYVKEIEAIKQSIESGRCETGLDAQRLLNIRSNAIITSFVKSNSDIGKIMDFFANHDRAVVQLVIDTSTKQTTEYVAASFDQLLTTTLEFANTLG